MSRSYLSTEYIYPSSLFSNILVFLELRTCTLFKPSSLLTRAMQLPIGRRYTDIGMRNAITHKR